MDHDPAQDIFPRAFARFFFFFAAADAPFFSLFAPRRLRGA
jgi:hypothetical protein